jgi:hypothetical protein
VGSLVEQARPTELLLSPGDLDEAMQALLKYERSLDKKLSAFDAPAPFARASRTAPPPASRSGRDRAERQS